jgi:putative phosphoribosyl transferase
MHEAPFADRHAAGVALATRLRLLAPADPVVLALPRGGVPVAAPIAHALGAPLSLLFVRKIGAPWHRELAVGAVAGDDATELVVDDALCRELAIAASEVEREAAVQRDEIARQRRVYLGDRPAPPLAGRTAIVVDDGIATGTTMRAALQALRRRAPKKLWIATPVASADALALLQPEADEVVCLSVPTPFRAVGLHYVDFASVEDAEVLALLAQTQRPA